MADPSGDFTARAIARNVYSKKSKELAQLGTGIVTEGIDDKENLVRYDNLLPDHY